MDWTVPAAAGCQWHRRQESIFAACKTITNPSAFVKFVVIFAIPTNPSINLKFVKDYAMNKNPIKYFIFK
jgi:hypothetical protein